MQHLDLGRAVIEPAEPVVAGSYATLRFTHTAGHPIRIGEGFDYYLKLEDRWGNPTALTHPGLHHAGTFRVMATDKANALSTASNPIRVISHTPQLTPCWADLHGQSEETIGTNRKTDTWPGPARSTW